MSHKVQVEDLTLNVRSMDRCWEFAIVHACGCPAKMVSMGHVRNRIVRVKQDNHRGPCCLRRCITATDTHVLPDQCTQCEITDARFAGVSVPQLPPNLPPT